MSFFATIFGYVLKFLYDIVNNYGFAIILFSILVKLIMLPLSIKQQKTLKKNEKMQEELKLIQFKYKNDPEKLNQEMMALYKREGMSPLSGCFSSIIQLILLMSVFFLVSSPLTYMVKMDSDVISNMKEIVTENSDSGNTRYAEIAIIQYVKNLENTKSVENSNGNEVTENQIVEENNTEGNIDNSIENSVENNVENNEINSENTENNETQSDDENNDFNIYDYVDQVNLNMDFFGIDLSQVPTQNLQDWKTLIIPVLYVISSFISIRMTNSASNKKKSENKLITDGKEENEEAYNPMPDANRTMMWFMPILSVSIAIIAPLGLALYWLMNNILMIIERIIINRFFDKEEEAEKDAQ